MVPKTDPLGLGLKNIEYEHEEPIKVVNFGDWHIGSKFCHDDILVKDIEYISKTKNVYCILTGDYLDNFGSGNGPKGGSNDQKYTPATARKLVYKLVKKLAKQNKILGILDGCHDLWSKKIDGTQFAAELAELGKTHWMGSYGNIKLKIGDIDYKFHAIHNDKGCSQFNVGSGLIKRYYRYFDFDVGFAAHYHQASYYSQYIREKYIYTVTCGSYKYSDSWLDKGGYPYAIHKMPAVILDNETHKITLCDNMREGDV